MGLIQTFPGQREIIQVDIVPSANITLLNKIIQYVGVTDDSYTNGYFYKCIFNEDDDEYKWININVQNNASIANYSYSNTKAYTISNNWTRVIRIGIVTNDAANALFLANINFSLAEITTSAQIEVQYRVRDAVIDYHPIETYNVTGNHILTLFYPLFGLLPDLDMNFDVYLRVTSGDSITIDANDIVAAITGPGMTGNPPIWDGNIEVEEEWEQNVSIPQMTFDNTSVLDDIVIITQVPMGSSIIETYNTVNIPQMTFDDSNLTDNVVITFDTESEEG